MITLALVGAGKWGYNYLKTVKEIKNTKIKYVCSGKKSLRSVPANYIKIDNYEALVNQKDIDGIIVATPPVSHYKITKFFLSNGINVLIEKPMTLDYKEALELAKIAQKTNKTLMVGHIYLYNPAFAVVERSIKKIDKIRQINCERTNPGPSRKDTSALWDWGPHDVSMLLTLLKSMPVSASARGVGKKNRETNFYNAYDLKFKFYHDICAHLHIGWLATSKKRKMSIKGQKGTIIFNDAIAKKVTLKDITTKKTTNINFSGPLPLEVELSEFINLIRKGKNDIQKLQLAVNVIKILEVCQKSVTSQGKEIQII